MGSSESLGMAYMQIDLVHPRRYLLDTSLVLEAGNRFYVRRTSRLSMVNTLPYLCSRQCIQQGNFEVRGYLRDNGIPLRILYT